MNILQDLRFALRGLRRAPGLLLVASLSLATGIAAVTTLWTATDTLFVRPLPWDPDGTLVFVGTVQDGTGGASSPSSAPDFLDLRDATATLELAAYRDGGVNLAGEPAEWIAVRRVSGDFFDVVGVGASLGRVFSRADEDLAGAEGAVLSHGLWVRRFGSDPGVLGRALVIDGAPLTVVGVLPAGFEFGFRSPDVWLPLRFTGDETRNTRSVSVVGRIGSAGRGQARAELDAVAARLAGDHPSTNDARTFRINGVRDEWFGGDTFQQGAVAALISALLVLLIACANVANLLLARGASRREEIALRRALGAGRARLLRQLLTESALLAIVGGVLGVLVSVAGLRGLRSLVPEGMPRTGEIGLDFRALLLASAVVGASTFLFGLVPALRTVGRAASRLGVGTSRGPTEGGSRLRGALVGAEIALAVVLVTSTVLVLRSVQEIRSIDPGFRTEDVAVFTLNFPEEPYPDEAALRAVTERVQAAVAALPGVTSAGIGVGVPTRSWRSIAYRMPGEPADEEARSVFARFATPGYLEVLGIEAIRGRGATPDDDDASPRVALVNERFADAHWPDDDAVGRTLQVGEHLLEVVGVVPDVHEYGPTFPPQRAVYLPLDQWPARQADVVMASEDPGRALAEARLAVAGLDAGLAVHGEATLENVLMRSAEQFTSLGKLLSVLAAAAVLLALAGVYGSMAYTVAQRVPEIGIRMSLGAGGGAIRRMVLRDAGLIALAGASVGVLLALGAARGIAAFLFGVGAADPVTFTAAVVLVLVVSLVAAGVPAHRASRVDPLEALRSL